MARTHRSMTERSSAVSPYLPPTMISQREMIKSDFVEIGFSSMLFSKLISIGLIYCSELLAIRINCPCRCCTNGKYSPSGSQMIMSSVVFRKLSKISLFTLKDLPEPGVPKISPFGFLSLLLFAIIMLPETVFRP